VNIEVINKLTARHAAKALAHMVDVNSPKCAQDSVRREFWFLKDDIVNQVNNVNQGNTTHEKSSEAE